MGPGRVVREPMPAWPGRGVPVVTGRPGPRESHPLEVQGTQARSVEGTLCNKEERSLRRGGSGPERQADQVEFRVDTSALGCVSTGAGLGSTAEGMLMAARREAVGKAGPSAVAGEVDSKEGELATDIGIDVGGLPPEAEVADIIGDH